MRVDCTKCRFAKRDEHNRYLDRCSGYGNCDFEEFDGHVKPDFYEIIEQMIKVREENMEDGEEYNRGYIEALKFINNWKCEDDGFDFLKI